MRPACFRDIGFTPLVASTKAGTNQAETICFAAEVEGKGWYQANSPQDLQELPHFQDVAGTIIGTVLAVLCVLPEIFLCAE
jgi:hypothetical protein